MTNVNVGGYIAHSFQHFVAASTVPKRTEAVVSLSPDLGFTCQRSSSTSPYDSHIFFNASESPSPLGSSGVAEGKNLMKSVWFGFKFLSTFQIVDGSLYCRTTSGLSSPISATSAALMAA